MWVITIIIIFICLLLANKAFNIKPYQDSGRSMKPAKHYRVFVNINVLLNSICIEFFSFLYPLTEILLTLHKYTKDITIRTK